MPEITTVPYIGEATQQELRRRIRGNRPTSRAGENVSITDAVRNQSITQFVLDTRQQRELAKVSDFRPEQSARQAADTSNATNRADRNQIRRGDFQVNRDDYEAALELHEERSFESQELDEDKRARATTDLQQWATSPDSFDFPGVDTPSRRRPRREEKDKPFVDTDALLRPFESDEDDDDGDGDEFIPRL